MIKINIQEEGQKISKLATKVLSSYSETLKHNLDTKMVYEEIPKTVDPNPGNLSKAVRNSLWTAQTENRVITGLTAAVKSLSSMPEDALFCFLAPPMKGDTASHMHEVLLKAFCFENDIYIIQVRREKNIVFFCDYYEDRRH